MENIVSEGDFLKVDSGDIYEVRGLIHPPAGYVAYPRYVRDNDGDRKSSDGHLYQKLSTLRGKMNYSQTITPSFIHFDSSEDRVVQIVPKEEVKCVLNPIARLNEIGRHNHLSKLEQDIVDFTNLLVAITGISRDNLGIIGSVLAGLATPSSDIDLIVFGCNSGRNFYLGMKEIFPFNNEMESYTDKKLKEHTIRRWGEEQFTSNLMEIERNKILQGRYRSRDFFIRLVPHQSDIEHQYGEFIVRSSGNAEVLCEIIDTHKAIFSPCEYSVSSEDDPFLTKVVGYRSRYAEHAEEGMRVRIRGRMESVISRLNGFHKQLVLGNSITDRFIPVE